MCVVYGEKRKQLRYPNNNPYGKQHTFHFVRQRRFCSFALSIFFKVLWSIDIDGKCLNKDKTNYAFQFIHAHNFLEMFRFLLRACSSL